MSLTRGGFANSSNSAAVGRSSSLSLIAKARAVVLSWARTIVNESVERAVHLIISRLLLLPTSKSLKSCAGVILTAPEPLFGSAYLSEIILISLFIKY